MSLETFLENITIEELEELKKIKEKQYNKNYAFSKVTFNDLNNLLSIEKEINKSKFNSWFDNKIEISKEISSFLEELILENDGFMYDYSEEDLKVNFIIPLLNKVKFKSIENKFRDFYELPIKYETDEFSFSGTTDFVVSKGLLNSKKPYFFIQEFKKGQVDSFPEPQLLAELIAAVELNNWSTIKGAYIVGSIWNFVILERLEKHKYQYYVSQNFDSTKINDLKDIYKNLIFVKNEIIEMIKNGE
jgi:hypothetical protein